MEKVCKGCGKAKARSEFYPHAEMRDKLMAQCRRCHLAYTSAWKKANPAKAKRHSKNGALKDLYGMTIQEYDALVEAQGARCRICDQRPFGSLHVDHCHATGKIRGLLCNPCNRGMGLLGDDVTRLRAAAAYLEAAHD